MRSCTSSKNGKEVVARTKTIPLYDDWEPRFYESGDIKPEDEIDDSNRFVVAAGDHVR